MKPTVKHLLQCLLVLCLCVILGTVSVIAAYALPTEKMTEHVLESLATFENEETYPLVYDGYYGSMLDNYSDGLMLNIAIGGTEFHTVFAAMSNLYASYYDCVNPMYALIKSLSGNRDDWLVWEYYCRYWNGYVVWLKPLLLFLTYPQIRLLNMALELSLAGLILWQMTKKKLAGYIPAVLLCWYAMCPVAVALCMEYSMSAYVALLSSLAVLLLSGKHGQRSRVWPYVFMLTGVCESFFNFLVNPVLGIVCGLGMWCLVFTDGTLWSRVKQLLSLGVHWVFGYLGMWASKWVVSSVLTKRNNISESIEKIFYHTAQNADGEEITRFQGLQRTAENLFSNPILGILCVALVLVTAVMLLRSPKTGLGETCVRAVPQLLLGLVPIAWTIVVATHSYQHFWFSYRTLCGSVLTFACFLLSIAWGQWQKRPVPQKL